MSKKYQSYLDKLKSLYRYPENTALSPYERVEKAIAREKPDRTPFDYWAVEEMTAELLRVFSLEDEEQLLRLLGLTAESLTRIILDLPVKFFWMVPISMCSVHTGKKSPMSFQHTMNMQASRWQRWIQHLR